MSAKRKRIDDTRPDGDQPTDTAAELIALVRLLACLAAREAGEQQQEQDEHGDGQV